MGITRTDFAAYFEAKKIGTYQCPVCRNEGFVQNATIGDSPNIAAISMPAAEEPNGLVVASHTFYGVSCTNCGFTTFFHRVQVDKWLADRKVEKPPQ